MKPVMTMEELRDYVNENGLFYAHLYGSKGKVCIYEDRYHNKRIGTVEIIDYKPIRNYRVMMFASNKRVLEIVRKRIKDRGWGLALSIIKPDETEIIRKWLKENEK